MHQELGRTHDPNRRSWVGSANRKGCAFPIQNLPFGAFQPAGRQARVGVAIGDRILDLRACERRGLLAHLRPEIREVCRARDLRPLMSLGRQAWEDLRRTLSRILDRGNEPRNPEQLLADPKNVSLRLPVRVGDYTDFYASIHHATNVGKLFRPDQPLLPNYKFVPVAYSGRASSLVVSGTATIRPAGQRKTPDEEEPVFGPTRQLDYELEVGFLVGPENERGCPVAIQEAEHLIFGLCLVNDWSARDIQAWEYQPLGPFLGKSFATSVGPWVVTLEALAPFRVAATRPRNPVPLEYLCSAQDRASGGIDLTLEVSLSTTEMRRRGQQAYRLSRSSFRDMYWTIAQMLTHHTSNGCNLRTGDLLASGTVSGSDPGSEGCLLEMTKLGMEPIRLPSGEDRRFLEDGDEVTLRGFCRREGFVTIGFGECRGRIVGRGT